jgi:carboxymethylenebutenolidase
MKTRITISGRDGAFDAYIARPKALPAPAIIVLQELFGVNADIRKTCDESAELGFLAVAPDLFWRQEPSVDLGVTSDADWQHGLRLYQSYDRDAGAGDVKDTLDAAAKLPDCTGKVAVLGYCLGALMVFLTAVRYGADAAVAYHGGDTEKYLGEVDGLHAQLLMHLAEEDEFISKAAQSEIKAALANKQTRRSTAIRVRITRSLGMVGHITTLRQPHSPTSGHTPFSIANCDDRRSGGGYPPVANSTKSSAMRKRQPPESIFRGRHRRYAAPELPWTLHDSRKTLCA